MSRIQFRYEIEIDASPEAVWKTLGDLGATHHWLPGLVSSRTEGSRRLCTTGDGHAIEEAISDFDNAGRTFAYAHLRTPAPMRGSKGVYRVVPTGRGARVLWDGSYEPAGAGAKAVETMLDGHFRASLDALKRYVETGRRWNEP